MARRILNRKDLRAQAEAAERQKEDDEERDDEDEDEDEEDESAEAGEPDEEADEEEVEAPPKKKKAPAKTSKPRTRTAKVVRMQYVWGVFNNSHQRVAVFPFKAEQEARDHAAKLSADKKSGSPFFVQPVKEPMEEKKEKE